MDEETVGISLVFLSAICFGTLGVLGKLAADAGLSIPTVLSLRFALATVLLWGILAAWGRVRLLTGRELLLALALGGIGYASMSVLYFVGLEFMTAGLVAIVLYTYPAFVVGFVAISRPDRVTVTILVALALAIGGVALITGADPAGADPRGVAVVLGAALAYATYIVVSQRVLVTVDPETLTAFVLPAAAISLIGVGVGTGTLATPNGVTAWSIAVAIAVLATVIPVLTFFAGLARLGASRASIVSTVEPAATVVLGAIVLAEPVVATTIAGGTMIVAGVILIHREGV